MSYSVADMQPKEDTGRRDPSQRPAPAPVRRALREVAASVEAWRKLRGLTQAQLAERAGVSRFTILRLENGDSGVTMENMFRVLRALGVLDGISRAIDPYESDIGRLRADEQLPERVRPRQLRNG
jgi:transcriptional regulator with XRE-family HTH domain